MADVGDITQQRAFVYFPQFHAADGNRTGIGLVPPHEDGGNGGFPAAAFPDQRSKAALRKFQVHAMQDFPAGFVGKPQAGADDVML